MTAKTLSPERMRQFHDWADEYPNKRSMLMMTLRLVEEEFGSIDDQGMEIAAELCGVNVAHVQGMVTFYTHFKRPAHGKHRFMVCATLMCALDGNTDASLTQIKNRLGLKPGQTSADGLFSCEKVECLADCDQPPVVQKDNEHFCKMKGPALDAYIDSLLAKEGKTSADYTATGAPAPVATDLRVAVLPPHYNFPGATDEGARHFDDKDPYLAPGQGTRVTTVPPPLKTPLTAPVAGTSFVKPSVNGHANGQNSGHNGPHHG